MGSFGDFVKPQGRLMPQMPARLQEMVKMSDKYICSGSPDFSPILKAAVGVVGGLHIPPWPLLVGERGHLALQAGEDPLPYLRTMWCCASPGGLLPEQVWDADPIPERGLYPGRPSGSAMPLVWAHAEFLKLLMARERGRPVEWLDSVERHFGHRRHHRP